MNLSKREIIIIIIMIIYWWENRFPSIALKETKSQRKQDNPILTICSHTQVRQKAPAGHAGEMRNKSEEGPPQATDLLRMLTAG